MTKLNWSRARGPQTFRKESWEPEVKPSASRVIGPYLSQVDRKKQEKRKRRLQLNKRKKPNRTPSPPLWNKREPVVKYLVRCGYKPIDLRGKGGNLWVPAQQKEFAPIRDHLLTLEISFRFSMVGGKATSYLAGWYTKSADRR